MFYHYDADECLSEELRIYSSGKKNLDKDAYSMNRLNNFLWKVDSSQRLVSRPKDSFMESQQRKWGG